MIREDMEGRVREGLASTYGEDNVGLFFDCKDILFRLFGGSSYELTCEEALFAAENAVPKCLDDSSLERFGRIEEEERPCKMLPLHLAALKKELKEAGMDERMGLPLMCSVYAVKYRCPAIPPKHSHCPVAESADE